MAIFALIAIRIVGLAAFVDRLPEDIGSHFVAADTLRYVEIANSPGTPYRDFTVEVPPLEVGFLELVAVRDAHDTSIRNAWVELVLDLIVAGSLAIGWNRKTCVWYLALGLLLTPYLYFRLDLLSVALAVSGLALVRRKRFVGGGVLLGLGVLTKFWPIVLIPVFLAQRRWRALISLGVTVGIGMIAWVTWVGMDGPQQVATFRNAGGWQLESIIGSILLVASSQPVLYDAGANRIGLMPQWLRTTSTTLLAASLAFLTWAGWRASGNEATPRRRSHRNTHDIDGLLALACVGVLLLLAPILSWQYIAWLLPWIAVLAAQRRRALTALGVGVLATTSILIFQGIQLTHRESGALVALVTRNALLIALVVAAAVALARSRARAAP